jgi:hypothetical protein
MQVGVYFESWFMQNATTNLNELTNLQAGINTVYLSFVDPLLKYTKNQNSFENTGLNFSSSFSIIKSSILTLQARGVKVFLAVGGGSYWSKKTAVNHQAVVALCDDLNCDGIDIDWEVGIEDDSSPVEVIKKLNSLTTKLISFTCFSTGAYPPNPNDKYSGMNIKALQECKTMIDQVNIMAYDAGKSYDSFAAFNAYRSFYPGRLNIGFEIGKQGWGDALLYKPELVEVSTKVSKDKLSGCFFWAYYSQPYESSISRQEAVTTVTPIFKPTPKPVYSTPSSVFIQCPGCKTRILNSWSVPK